MQGPIHIGVVGISTKSPIYSAKCPLFDGANAVMSGICLKQVITKFLMFPVHRRVLDYHKSRYKQSGRNLNDLPKNTKVSWWRNKLQDKCKVLKVLPSTNFRVSI